MKERRAANALLGMAAGEALSDLLRYDGRGITILLKDERLPQPQSDFACPPNQAPMPGLHGCSTQVALLLRSQQAANGIQGPTESMDALRTALIPALDILRKDEPLIKNLCAGDKRREPSLAAAAWLSATSVCFDKTEELIPWVISWMKSLTTNTLSIACGVDYALLNWALSRGLERQDAIDIMNDWRESSQAMQSPVPDKNWWILHQSFNIFNEYGKEAMLDFLDAALGSEQLLGTETVGFYTQSIGMGLKSRDYRAVMQSIADQKEANALFGALCGAVAALSGKTPPNWIRDALPAYNDIISETKWSIESERKWNAVRAKYQADLPLTLKKKRRKRKVESKSKSQMTLFKS